MFDYNKLFATFFYSGCSKKAPGTAGSIAALPFVFLVNYLILKLHDFNGFKEINDFFHLLGVHFILCGILFAAGSCSADKYAKDVGKDDPKEVVIDEVVGMWLTLIICAPGAIAIVDQIHSAILLVFIFLLFRMFDAIKPWPISWLDRNIKGGIGIMVDDIAAAFFASLMFYSVWFAFADYWKA
ncbi:MAG: phosphatidylglycerophosphatase A [Alphaproteobacteria bacterium]|nr:phosphatidylglycerophosphatase A [Alphaproteobacteria bacterium]OJV13503.1 MAG: hypothetical protein BGO27_04775 [Alphaproteobacteria bacterium 33-17]